MSFSTLGNVLDSIQVQAQWAKQRQFTCLLKHWNQIVGASVATHARPTGVFRQVLQVAVSSSVWAQGLTFERRSILAKIHTLLGDSAILDIHFSTARWEKNEGDPRKPSQSAPPQQSSPLAPPESPGEAFERWASLAQSKEHSPHHCPQCGIRCSSAEVDRWKMCRYCAARFLFSHSK